VKPRRATPPRRIILVGLSRFLEWRPLLTVVKPETPFAGTARIPVVLALEIA